MPDPSPYTTAILGVYGAAGRSAAAQLHARWLAERACHPLYAHVAVLGGVVVLGTAAMGTGWVLTPAGAVPFAAGAVLGGLTWAADSACVRAHARAAARRSERPTAAHWIPPQVDGDARWGIPLVRERWWRWAAAAGGARWGLLGLTLLAALEELVYRGILVQLAAPLPAPAEVVALAGATIAFGASHAYAGWHQAVVKTGVGAVFLGVALGFGVAAAVVAHACFNALVWAQANHRRAGGATTARPDPP